MPSLLFSSNDKFSFELHPIRSEHRSLSRHNDQSPFLIFIERHKRHLFNEKNTQFNVSLNSNRFKLWINESNRTSSMVRETNNRNRIFFRIWATSISHKKILIKKTIFLWKTVSIARCFCIEFDDQNISRQHWFVPYGLFTHQRSTHSSRTIEFHFSLDRINSKSMDNNSSISKNELIETMFKSLNSYTNDLQQGLFISLFSHRMILFFLFLIRTRDDQW